jgi:hypothetical protein
MVQVGYDGGLQTALTVLGPVLQSCTLSRLALEACFADVECWHYCESC